MLLSAAKDPVHMVLGEQCLAITSYLLEFYSSSQVTKESDLEDKSCAAYLQGAVSKIQVICTSLVERKGGQGYLFL